MKTSLTREQKNLQIVSQLHELALSLKFQFFKNKYPEKSEKELKALAIAALNRESGL